jgi:hypothetical protein
MGTSNLWCAIDTRSDRRHDGRMPKVRPGYFAVVSPIDLVIFLGDRHLDRSELPHELTPYVDEALRRGLVFEDCRDKLACQT